MISNIIRRALLALVVVTFIAIAWVLIPMQASADENEETKTVRVAVEGSGLFFDINDSGEPISGYAYEYIQTIAAYENWTVEYVYFNGFSDCIQAVMDGDVDLFYDVSYTEERASKLLYPEPPMGTEDYCIYCLANNKSIHSDDYSTFNGKTIGVTAGTIEAEALSQWCQENSVDLKIIEYPGDPEKAQALDAGEIDLELEISMIVTGDYSALATIFQSEYYLVASPNRKDLLEDINDGCAKIQDVDKYFLYHLNEKYYSKTIANKTLSGDELEWVENHDALRVGYLDESLPFSDKKMNGDPDGVVKDIIPLMLQNAGVDDEIGVEYYGYQSEEDACRALESGAIDVAFPVRESTYFAVKNNVLITSGAIDVSYDVVHAGTFSEDMLSLIAVNENSQSQKSFVETYYPDSEIVYCGSNVDCMNAVVSGEAECTVMNGLIASGLLAKTEYKDLHSLGSGQMSGVCFAVGQDNSALLTLLNRAVANTDNNVALDLAFDYIGSGSASKALTFYSTHKVLVLTIIIVVLGANLAIAIIFAVRSTRNKRKLEAANKAKTDFLFNMSHDIRTPMNAVIGFTDIALDNLDDKERLEDSLHKTKEASHVLLSLINGVLEMSRIESGNIDLDEIPGDVRYSFANIESTMMELAQRKGVELTFEVGDVEDLYVFADFDRALRVFVNIISNGIKYTQSGGWLKVCCTQVGRDGQRGLYKYTFEDNGIGISEEFQERLFDVFSREKDSTSSGVQGSGLGLSVVKSLVDLMGGSIECESELGKGTKFTVVLPFRIQSEEEHVQFVDPDTGEIKRIGLDEGEPSEIDLTGMTVLLVDDNEMNREIAEYLLESNGLVVESADCGTAAVELVDEKGPEHYDFVLMDIQMPDMSGYDATRIIREKHPDSKLPIIALSANAFAEDKAASLEAGMNGHASKPIDVDELFGIIASCLR